MKPSLRFLPDRFILMLLTAVVLASLFPATGQALETTKLAANLAIALLFFLHGARLSKEETLAGAAHWRLHSVIFSVTFLLFPLLGLALQPLLLPLATPELYVGVMYLCCLPATVQSAIALTSMARGNVPAAICSASASSLIGIFVTPLLVGMVIANAGQADIAFDVVLKIMLQLLLPFVLGQLLRRWIGAWVKQRRSMLKIVDQSSILLVVYVAFSQAVSGGLWRDTPLPAILGLAAIVGVILAAALGISIALGRLFKFNTADQITLLFAGSQKSLATGVPMAQIMFASNVVGAMILPLMLYHQLQLMVCSTLAARYARRVEPVPENMP